MPKVGFRTSMFGFHKSDVIDYLNETHKEYTTKEQENSKQISDLKDKLDEKDASIEELKNRLAEMEKEVSYYRDKETEIEKMSVSIGTMYLVAKQNADEMISSAQKYATEVTEYSQRQLDATNKACEQLLELKEGVSQSAEKFATDLATLSDALNDSRDRLEGQMRYLEAESSDIIIDGGSTENE